MLPITTFNGVATAGVWRNGDSIVKVLRPGLDDPAHWAYWRREALAYTSGVLPDGPSLRAPRCLGVDESPTGIVLRLEDVAGGPPVALPAAARALGAWQSAYVGAVPPLPWLATGELTQRVAAKGPLEFSLAPAGLRDPLAEAWSRRDRLVEALDVAPHTLCHGDFHAWNLFSDGDTVVAIDWSNLGRGPAGSDIALLALSDEQSPVEGLLEPYADALGVDARLGYCVAGGLTGVSRTHWMLTRDPDADVTAYAEWALARIDEALSSI